jgi:ribonuclease J
MSKNKKKKKPKDEGDQPDTNGIVRVIPLGGLGEIGKNMMYVEYQTVNTLDSIIIDAGIMFPENDMMGIDYIIPDFGYLMDRLDTVRGVIITHGHEDHIGAIRHVMEYVDAPVFSGPLTCALLEGKLKQAKLRDRVELVTVQGGDAVDLGPFTVEFFHMCHSIPDTLAIGITTPIGLLVHTGDFKLDHTPVDGKPPDFAKMAEFAQRGVLALLSDSTNSTVPGWTPSETVIDEAFTKIFMDAPGRIIVGTFASLISRVQQVANVTRRFGRKLALAGYSINENVKLTRKMGYLDLPASMMIDLAQANDLPDNQVVIMATGTQGESGAVLARLSNDQHPQLQVRPTDTVIMSAHPIPGNEELVFRTMNKLIQRGAEVIYDPIASVHVSGHAAQEEQKFIINLLKPKFFVPVHGELRHLHMHAKLAMSLGVPRENIAVVENGTILTFTPDSLSVGERVPGGYVFVDGAGVGDVGPEVMRDREKLGQDGFVIVNLTLDRDSRQILGQPEIISRGFVYQREAQDLMESARDLISGALNDDGFSSTRHIRHEVERRLEKFFYSETKRRPMVYAFVIEV